MSFALLIALILQLSGVLTGGVNLQSVIDHLLDVSRAGGLDTRHFNASFAVRGRTITCNQTSDAPDRIRYLAPTWTCDDMRVDGRHRLQYGFKWGISSPSGDCNVGDHTDYYALCRDMLRAHGERRPRVMMVQVIRGDGCKNDGEGVTLYFRRQRRRPAGPSRSSFEFYMAWLKAQEANKGRFRSGSQTIDQLVTPAAKIGYWHKAINTGYLLTLQCITRPPDFPINFV